MLTPYNRPLTLEEIIYIGIIVLLGEEDLDFIFHQRDPEEWQLYGIIHQN